MTKNEGKTKADVIEEFISYQRSDTTKKVYRSHLKKFFEFLNLDPNTYFDSDREFWQDLRDYAETLKDRPPTSQKSIVATIKSFFVDNDVQLKPKHNKIINNIRVGSQPITEDLAPTNAQIKQILQHADVKYKALFLFNFTSGMRIEETLSLTFNDVDIENRDVLVPDYKTKTNRKHYTCFSPEAQDTLKDWLKVRDKFLVTKLKKSKYARRELEKKGIKAESYVACERHDGTPMLKWRYYKESTELTKEDIVKLEPRIFPFSKSNARTAWNGFLEKAGEPLNSKTSDQRLGNQRYLYHIHTLRKAFKIRLKDSGLARDDIEMLLNHTLSQNGAYEGTNNHERTRTIYEKHVNCLSVFSDMDKFDKMYKPKIAEQDTAISSLTRKNKEYEDLIQQLKEQNERIERVSNHQFDRIRMLEYRIEDMSYQRALDATEEMEEKEYLKKFPTAKERKRDWDRLYNLMKTDENMTAEEKSRYWFLNDKTYWRLRNKKGIKKHWIDALITP